VAGGRWQEDELAGEPAGRRTRPRVIPSVARDLGVSGATMLELRATQHTQVPRCSEDGVGVWKTRIAS
jgi:hypothetical protein